jgi:hypothetical protein
VVPPGLPHAFAAPPGSGGELLIIITPGVERFEYFRHLVHLVARRRRWRACSPCWSATTYFLPSEPWQKTDPGPLLAEREAGLPVRGDEVLLAGGLPVGADRVRLQRPGSVTSAVYWLAKIVPSPAATRSRSSTTLASPALARNGVSSQPPTPQAMP